MDSNNWRADQGQVKIPGQGMGGEAMANPGMEGGDWRTGLQPETRQRAVNEILETLKRHLPFNGQDGLHELKSIAVRFEERIYTAAISQQDYLRKISLKMLQMESSAASNSRNPHDSAIQNKVQQLPIPMVFNQSQVQHMLLSQNNISSTGVPNSVGGMSQGTMPDVPGKNPNTQNMSNVTVNAKGNSMGQGVPSKINANAKQQPLQWNMPSKINANAKQQPLQWNMANMLHNQGQLLQPMQPQPMQQQLMQLQLVQPQLMQQQFMQSKLGSLHQANTLVKDMQQRVKPSGPLLQQQKQKQLLQSQRAILEVPLTTLDSSAQTGNAIGGDWQEKIYQKIKSLNEMYFPELNEIYQRIAAKLQQHDVLPQQLKNEQLQKLRNLKVKFERIIIFLRTLKNEVQPHHKEKIVGLEKLIVNILNFNRLHIPVSSFQQGQLAQPPMHAMQQSQISQMNANEGQMNFQTQPMNGSRAAVGEDLVFMTKCHLQDRNFFSQDGPGGTKRMRQYSSAMPSNVVSSTDSMNDRFRHLTVNEPDGASSVRSPQIEMESRVETTEKGLVDALAQVTKLQPSHTKLDHIEEMLAALIREKGPELTSSQLAPESISSQLAPAAVLPIPSSMSVVLSPKLDFPIFDAEDPMAWLSSVNRYFRVHKTNESAKVELSLAAMDGPALHWMQSILRRRPAITWKKFGLELLRYYGYSNPAIANPFESLPAITQTGSVDEYVDMFVSRTAHVQRLPDSHSLGLFLNGLRDDIRVRILSRDMTNTFDAIHLALEIERELSSVGTACPGKGIIELSHADYVELMSKGLCFKCRKPCQPLHNCSGKCLRVVIAAEEDGGDETMACGEVAGPEAT